MTQQKSVIVGCAADLALPSLERRQNLNGHTKLVWTKDDQTEALVYGGVIHCIVIQAEKVPTSTAFYTPADLSLQVGSIVHPAGKEIQRHRHRGAEPYDSGIR